MKTNHHILCEAVSLVDKITDIKSELALRGPTILDEFKKNMNLANWVQVAKALKVHRITIWNIKVGREPLSLGLAKKIYEVSNGYAN